MNVIALEGIDCAGKTTTAKLLADSLGGIVYATPPRHYLQKRTEVDRSASDEDHYQFYLLGVVEASGEIAELRKNSTVILDRYWVTTVAYHRAMGVHAKLADFGDIVLPDVTVYLTVNREVQISRFKQRGMTPGDRRMFNKINRIKAEYELLFANNPCVIRVDTSAAKPRRVANLILQQLPLI